MKDFKKEKIRFILKTEMLVGDGIAKDLPIQLENNNWRKVLCVIDKGLYDHNAYVKEICALLKEKMEAFVLHISEMPEPTYDYLDKAIEPIRSHKLDCVVGIGGGSTMDLAKGLATLMTNPGKALSYRGFGKVKNMPLPVIALPSTAGTGSDVTPYAVFIDTIDKWKFGINTEYNYPRIAMYDPRFLDSCPKKIYASAGMDAMTHTLESFVAKNGTEISRLFSKKAFQLLFTNLKKVAKGDTSMETKLNLLVGSGCAGAALMNSGAGPAGALSYPLGVFFDVPHGLAGSVFLPEVIRYNVEQGYEEYSELYDLVFEDKSLSAKQKSMKFAEEIKILSDELGIPVTLNGFGVKTDADLELIVKNSMQLKAAFDQNPVPFGQEQIRNLIFGLR